MGKRIRPAKTQKIISEQKNNSEDRMAWLLDCARDFEDFRELLPALKKDLKAGLTAAELRQKYLPFAQARQINAILTSDDALKAAEQANKLIDREEGRAVERKQVTHQFENLSDDELDAVLRSELSDIEDEDTVSEH